MERTVGYKSVGVQKARQTLEIENELQLRHAVSLDKFTRETTRQYPLRLNLGCGHNRRPGWTNIDLFEPSADYQLDLREMWPFPNRSVEYIYSEHLFEHLSHPDETLHFLTEARRVLDPRGTFDVGVPDTEWPIKAYLDAGSDYWPLAKAVFHPVDCHTRLDHLNYHFRQGGEHKYAWDKETLAAVIRSAKFQDIVFREWDKDLDSLDRRIGTIYLRAKPYAWWELSDGTSA